MPTFIYIFSIFVGNPRTDDGRIDLGYQTRINAVFTDRNWVLSKPSYAKVAHPNGGVTRIGIPAENALIWRW